MKEDLSDDEYLKKYLLEATMKSVLDKMVMKIVIHSSDIEIFMLLIFHILEYKISQTKWVFIFQKYHKF